MSGYTAFAVYSLPDMGPDVQLYRILGPGMSHAGDVPFARPAHAEDVTRLLARAFEAGRQAKALEIREVLGIEGGHQ